MKKHFEKHKGKVVGLVALAVVGFVAFSSLPKQYQNLHIDSVSPESGPDGTTITLTGSGFSTNSQGGDYLKIEGKNVGAVAYSEDGGKTIQYTLDLSATKEAKECVKKLTKKGTCKIGLKVMDTSSKKESNEVHFSVTPYIPPPIVVAPPRLPTSVSSCFPLITLSPTTPPAQTINRGTSGAIVKFDLTSDCSVPATFQNFAITILPNFSGLDQHISAIHLYDDASGVLLSTIPASSLSFSNVNEPILPGQTITFRVTADISSSAIPGFQFIGACGGCNGVLLKGNDMTVGN